MTAPDGVECSCPTGGVPPVGRTLLTRKIENAKEYEST
jgi:hypothetical protein